MNKRQADHRPDEKPADQGAGKDDPSKPKSNRRMPQVPEDNKGFRKPEGHPIDKQAPKPGTEGKDILDGQRSDRESGRPLQLEDDDESEIFSSDQPRAQLGRADSEPGRGRRQQEGCEGPKSYKAEKTMR